MQPEVLATASPTSPSRFGPSFTSENLVGRPAFSRRAFELGGIVFPAKHSGDEYRTLCPFHNDKSPSLDVNVLKATYICRACGVGGDAVRFYAEKNGVSPEDAIAEFRKAGIGVGSRPASPETPRVTRTTRYEIKDAAGRVVAVHVRKELSNGKKEFAWERNGRSGLDGLPVSAVPLYGSERLADSPNTPVVLCEGEKAADALTSRGFVALGTVMGAGGTPGSAALEVLRGREVVLWPDFDELGRKHMERIAAALLDVASSVRILKWGQQENDDAFNFFARGGTDEQLDGMLADAPEWQAETKTDSAEPSVDTSAPAFLEGPRMVRAEDVKEEKIEWLWGGRIPKRYLTFIGGDPGLGKSHIAVDLAARLSRGSEWPDSGKPDPGATLFMSSEDGIADVLRPRLRVAGADLLRVGFLVGKYKPEQPTVEFLLTLKEDLAALEARLPSWEQELGLPIRMLVVDPFLNHLGKVDPNREGEVRPLLAEVAGFLRRTDLAMLGIRHLNKAQEKALLYRAGGSIAFTGAARAEYIVGEDPDEPGRRVFARIKGNLSLEPDALAYRIISTPIDPAISAIEWMGPTEKRAEDVISTARETGGPQLDRAVSMLTELLGEGRDVPVEEIFKRAEELKIGRKTVYAASKKLGVRKRPAAFGEGWTWSLTEEVGS